MKAKILSLFFAMLLCITPLFGCQALEQAIAEQTNAYSSETDSFTVPTAPKPYSFVFVSNGDGTCYINNVLFNYDHKENYVLEFPEISPEGDTVTDIRYQSTCAVPHQAFREDFEEKIIKPLADTLGDDSFYYKQVLSYFYLYDPETANEKQREEMYKAYPITKQGAVYILDPNTTVTELIRLHSRLSQANIPIQDILEMEKKAEYEGGVLYPDTVIGMTFPATLRPSSLKFLMHCFSLESITIPEGITVVENDAFHSCTNLKSVTLPSTVKQIGRNAFASCTSLSSITIPASCERVSISAFSECSSLESIDFEVAEGWEMIEDEQLPLKDFTDPQKNAESLRTDEYRHDEREFCRNTK